MIDSIREISRLNLARCLRWHPAGLASWSLSDWAVALAGEVGELCNVIKKLNRYRDGLVGNKESASELSVMLWKEIADVYLYLDLFSAAAGVDLPTAIVKKFDEVSERNGFPERLSLPRQMGVTEGALQAIADERARQINDEGYDRAHDDAHQCSELAFAAVELIGRAAHENPLAVDTLDLIESGPGWNMRIKSPRDALVKAAALICAEIERLDRAGA